MFVKTKLPLRYFFLFFSIFSFILAVFIFNYDLPKIGFTPSEKYKESLSQKITDKIQVIEHDISFFQQDFFQKKLEKSFDLFTDYKHNVYVYENEELILWTDYHFNITKEILNSSQTWKVFQQKEGIFLIYKKHVIKKKKSYDFIVVLPLYYDYQIDNKYLVSHFNQVLFDGEDQQIFLKHQLGTEAIYHQTGDYLFSFKIDESARQSYYILIVWAILLITGFVSAIFSTILWIRFFENKQRYFVAMTILILFLFVFRLGMLNSGFPFRYLSIDFFNPKFFASSIIFPSFGDLFLNVLSVFIIICYLFRIFQYFSILYFITKLSLNKAIATTIVLLIVTNLVMWCCYSLLENIYFHSQSNFDITTSIQFNYFKFAYILIFIMLIVSYFIFCHLILVTLSRLTSELKTSINYYILGVCIFFLFIPLFLEGNSFFIYFLNSFYIFIVFEFGFYKNLVKFLYKSYLYLFFVGFVGSIMGAYTIFQFSSEQEQNYKERMAKELITHHDFQGEYLLAKVGKQIQQDLFIRDKFSPFSFMNPQVKKELVRQKVKRVYLNNYFDKYDINVSVFDNKGKGDIQNKLLGNYQDIYETYNKQAYQTEYSNLFFINNLKEYFLSRYLHFIEIKKEKTVLGYVVLNLTLKKFRENSVYPKLLENRNKHTAFAEKLYSYAVFDKENILFNVGKINYENAPHNQIRFLKTQKLQTISIEDYNHLLMKGTDGRTVVVSSPNTSFKTIFTNFAYFFLMLLLTFFIIISIVNLYWRFQNRSFSFSSKIQTYLNIAYFLPLAMVSIATLSLIQDSYENDLKESYQEKANKIKYHLSTLLEQYNNQSVNENQLRYNVLQVSKYANVDVNLYDAVGKLVISSQPLLYETHLLSNYVNPKAMNELTLHHNNQSLLEESIGDFHYNAVYVRLISSDTGKLLGILSIPFFNSREALDKKKIDVIAMVLNIFVVIFLIIVILSYVSFKSLTTPLELIATKLKRTSFSDQNEPLEWRVNDEIGALVNEYNAMLMKLEESKKALSRNEKESAWREMAQQVAHEIKNPLTPMKLKLQHLQYTLGDSEQEQRLKKSMGALLTQVETLNDIATSFSSFAKMPIPENIHFNITAVLKNTIQLYENNQDMFFKKDIHLEDVWVNGDEKLLGRILTNLILNGKQAVTSDKKPIVELSSRIENKQFLIELKDNGDGIPEDIQHKVFLPNFSTKYTGSGIGLAVAKRGIEHAGGKIWFETKENEGTSFFILLPII